MSEAITTVFQTKKEGKERRQKIDYDISGFEFFGIFCLLCTGNVRPPRFLKLELK